MSDTHSDKLLSDEELVAEVWSGIVKHDSVAANAIGYPSEKTSKLLIDLINTQKRLYAESVKKDILTSLENYSGTTFKEHMENKKKHPNHKNLDDPYAWTNITNGEQGSVRYFKKLIAESED